MTEVAQSYNPERFKNAARFYTNGRPTYPKLLAQRVADLVGVSQRHAVLDLGTGPGFLALDFAPLAGAVTAVDPAPEMLREAEQNFAHANAQIRLVQGSSAALDPQLGRFRLVTIGRAFHWMDRAQTLRSLDGLLEPGGAVALFGEHYPEVNENAWHADFQALIDSYSTDDPARRQLRAALSHEAILLASAFNHLERVAVLETRHTPVERFVARALSFATTWHGRPGSREEDLPHEVRLLLAPHADERGYVREVIEGQALVARRTADLT
jgi:ubiquinone/menaquinone biosynthesis C-methylase UbiE